MSGKLGWRSYLGWGEDRNADNGIGVPQPELSSSNPEFGYNFHVVLKSSTEVIEAFSKLVRPEIEDERIDLAKAALTFARIEYPEMDPAVYLRQIDELGERAGKKI